MKNLKTIILLCAAAAALTSCASVVSTAADGHPNRKTLTLTSVSRAKSITYRDDAGSYWRVNKVNGRFRSGPQRLASLPGIGSPGPRGYANDQIILSVPRGAGPFRPNRGRIDIEFDPRAANTSASVEIRVVPHFNWWVLGNILYGGPVGAIADGIGGAMWNPLMQKTVTFHGLPTFRPGPRDE